MIRICQSLRSQTAVVMGCCNFDITSTAKGTLLPNGPSNAVQTTSNAGGVGRNIAEAFSKIVSKRAEKSRVYMLSFIGDDGFGPTVKSSLPEFTASGIRVEKGKRTGVYNATFDQDGNIAMAGVDDEINRSCSFELTTKEKDLLSDADQGMEKHN